METVPNQLQEASCRHSRAVMAEVIVDVGGAQVVAAIAKESAERLNPPPAHR
jgi:hypothetical protein